MQYVGKGGALIIMGLPGNLELLRWQIQVQLLAIRRLHSFGTNILKLCYFTLATVPRWEMPTQTNHSFSSYDRNLTFYYIGTSEPFKPFKGTLKGTLNLTFYYGRYLGAFGKASTPFSTKACSGIRCPSGPEGFRDWSQISWASGRQTKDAATALLGFWGLGIGVWGLVCVRGS